MLCGAGMSLERNRRHPPQRDSKRTTMKKMDDYDDDDVLFLENKVRGTSLWVSFQHYVSRLD